jgi:hypothetical protein
MSPLLQLSYWFDQTPVALSPNMAYAFFGLFAALAIAAALLRIAAKRTVRDALDKEAFRMSGNSLALISALGFVWLFCSYEEVQFFGMRAWFLLLVAIFLVSLFRVYRFLRVKAPQERFKRQSLADVNKYLPRRSR